MTKKLVKPQTPSLPQTHPGHDAAWASYWQEKSRWQEQEIERLNGERAIVNAAVTGKIANAPPVVEALQQFVRQWNACGPNSDFGRYFGSIRDIAVAALAKHQGMEEPAAEPGVPLTPIESLLVEWWGSDMDNAELFNRAVRLNPQLAEAMQRLPEKEWVPSPQLYVRHPDGSYSEWPAQKSGAGQ